MNSRFSFVSTLLVLSALLALALAGCQSAGAPEQSASIEAAAIDVATDVPATDVPATEVPPTEVSATEVPPTEVPPTEVPATATPAPATPVAATDTAELAAILGNLSYPGLFPDESITLVDGYAAYEDGSSGTPYVELYESPIVSGDLDGDGTEDAVALLRDESTGSGSFTFLVVVADVTGNPTPTEALMIGDRMQVKQVTVDGNAITVDMITQGPEDPLCCASWNASQVFTLEDGQLVAGELEYGEVVSLADIDGTSWRLVDLNEGTEPALADVAVTVQFDGDQISGNAGCNQFTGTIAPNEELPQNLTISELAVTDMLCAEDVMAQETLFLDHLQNAVGWWYDGGNLTITYAAGENEYRFLNFVPNDAAETATMGDKPAYVAEMEGVFGPPSQEAFGSAVFFETLAAGDDLEAAALAHYKHFVGDLWDQYGESAWMGPWQQVYARAAGQTADIVTELHSIEDSAAQSSVEMILSNIQDPAAAQQALQAAFDDPSVTDLVVYTLGDSAEMSGLEIAGRRANGETTFLVFLLD